MIKNKKLFLATLISFLFTFTITSPSWAQSVQQIIVQGNQRIETQAIIKTAAIPIGQFLSEEDINDSIKLLMASGEFSNVTIKQSGSKVIIKVTEYQRINQITFQGNKKLDKEALLYAIGLKQRDTVDEGKLHAAAQNIIQSYRLIGMDGVEVAAHYWPAGKGRSNVAFIIKEGAVASIAHINFVGAKHFSQSRLREVITSKEKNIFSWFTRTGIYNEQQLMADEENLRRFYQSKGFADFRIISRTATIDKNNRYTIIFAIEEGRRYRLGNIEIHTAIKGLDSVALAKKLLTKSGDYYDVQKIDGSVEILNEVAADQGFAFAKANVYSNRDFDNNTISLVYNIDKGPRIYIERINIIGNTKTRDYVIRRALDINEGDAFNQELLRQGKRRLDLSNFFQGTQITTSPGSGPDKIVINVAVREMTTGNISFFTSYSFNNSYAAGDNISAFMMQAAFSEYNFLGKGQSIQLSASYGQRNSKSINISFAEPYFLGYRIRSSLEGFWSTHRTNNKYDIGQIGTTAKLGFALTDNLGADIGYNLVRENFSSSQGNYPPAFKQQNRGLRNRSSLHYGLVYNSLDNTIIPHDGLFIRGAQELAGLGGQAKFLKSTLDSYFYKTLIESLDVIAIANFGAGDIYQTQEGGVQVFDMFKNSYDMIRGFRYNSIGPRQRSGKDGKYYFIGGKKSMNAGVELNFPMPYLTPALGMRAALFVTGGTIYDSFYKDKSNKNPIEGNIQQWRASAGASIIWNSPLGPLRFDFAYPLKKYKGDIVDNFVFGLATQF